MSQEADIIKHVAICELLYIAEGTALDDPKTSAFCVKRIQQLAQGETIPLLLKPQVYREKLDKVLMMLKNRTQATPREMPALPKAN